MSNEHAWPVCRNTILLAAALALAGCAINDTVVFVTKTSIGLDGDLTTGSASIAYDRTDGYIAPRYPDGAVPPVVASIQTDLGVFVPQISQTYATGEAALILASPKPMPREARCDPHPMQVDPADNRQQKKTMFFGTSATLGIKLTFSPGGPPDSIILGYKRREVSVIPIGTKVENGIHRDFYPSVIASISTRVEADTIAKTSVPLNQFFATGAAARCLATLDAVHDNFTALAGGSTKPTEADPKTGALRRSK